MDKPDKQELQSGEVREESNPRWLDQDMNQTFGPGIVYLLSLLAKLR